MEEKRQEYRGFDKEIWPQIQFHNERIYKNLEIFIQVTLAICVGLVYLAVNKVAGNKELVAYVIKIAAWIQVLLGVYTSIAIIMNVIS